MDTDLGPQRLALDESAESNRISTPLITAIRRDQIPEDMRSAFLPDDIILFCEPRRKTSSASLKRARAFRKFPLPTSECPWCMADDTCAVLLIVTLEALVWLGGGSTKNKETFAFRVFKYTIAALSPMLMLLTLVLVHINRYGTKAYDSVNLRCSQGVKLHCVHNLALRMLSPSSLFLLQRPMLSVRSFFRYYQFFSKRRTGEPADQEVDSCIRSYAAEGLLSHAGLIDDGSNALLGLAPCQDIFTGFGWGFSQLKVLYRSYREWKRWRLAALVYERLQGREGASLQRGDMDDHEYVNPLEGLGGGGGYKWRLVDPRIFSSRLPSKPRAAQA